MSSFPEGPFAMMRQGSKPVKVLTFGCKVNQYESRALEEELSLSGASLAGEGEIPGVVIINTCTVTHRSDSHARALIRSVRRENPSARIVVTGCYAAVEPGKIAALGADLVVSTTVKEGLVSLALSDAKGIHEGGAAPASLRLETVTSFDNRKRAYLKVQDGCDCRCAYCIVPFARGPSRSLSPEDVAEGIARLAGSGHKEVILTGIHLGFWGKDHNPAKRFSELLDIAESSGINSIRLSSLEPMEVTDELIGRMRDSKKLCPHLHIPLQSGSNRILNLMGRPYGAEMFRGRVERALAEVRGLCLGFDVIVGFPGETGDDFARTLELLTSIPFCYLHVFPFSPRKNTKAWSMEGRVAAEVVKERASLLRDLSLQKKEEFYRANAGREMLALPEMVRNGSLLARTPNYIEADVPWNGEIPDGEIPVRLERWDGTRLAASLLAPR